MRLLSDIKLIPKEAGKVDIKQHFHLFLSNCYLGTVIIHKKRQIVYASVLETNSIPSFSFK